MTKFRKFLSVLTVLLILFTYSGFYGDLPKAEASSLNVRVNLSEWVLDDANDYIYAISSEAKKLLFIKTSDLSVEKEISFDYPPSDIEMTNEKLYIPLTIYRENDNFLRKIVVIDIPSKTIEKSISPQNNAYKVAVDGNKLFYIEFGHRSDVYVYDLLTGTEQKIGNYVEPDILVNREKHILFIGAAYLQNKILISKRTTNYSIIDVRTFDFNSNIVLDENSIYFSRQRMDSSNLYSSSILFEENIIYAKGTYVFSTNAIYNRDTLKRVIDLPYSIKLAAVSNNGSIFLFNESKRSITKYNSISELSLIQDIYVDTDRVSIAVESTKYIHVTAKYSDGRIKDVTNRATYQISDTDVAEISSEGYIKGLSGGKTTLSVTYLGKTKVVEITVPSPGYSITDWTFDEDNGYIYAVSKLTKKLLFIRTSDMQVDKKIDLGDYPSDIEIFNGKLYIPVNNFDVKKVVVVDIKSKSIERSIVTQGYVFKIAIDSDMLFYTEYAKFSGLYAYNLLSNTEQKIGDYSAADITVDRTNHILYIGESNSLSSKLLSLNTADFSIVSQSTYKEGKNEIGFPYPSRKIVYDSGSVYYAGRRFNSGNLNIINGNFNDTIIYAKGNYAFSSRAVYNCETFNKSVNLPLDSISLACMDSKGAVYIYSFYSKSFIKLDSISSMNPVPESIRIFGNDTLFIAHSNINPVLIVLNAYVLDQYGHSLYNHNQTVTWSVYDSAYKPPASFSFNATGGNCNITISKNAAEGIYKVQASLSTQSKISSTMDIKLYKQIPSIIYPDVNSYQVPVAGDRAFPLGAADQYGKSIDNYSVVWAVYDSALKPVEHLSIRNDGFLTVDSSASEGNYTIKATMTSNPLLYVTKSITLSKTVPESVDITGEDEFYIPSNGSITSQYTATVRDTYSDLMKNEKVSWDINVLFSEKDTPIKPSISSSGSLTFTSETSTGSYVIRATSDSNPYVYKDFYVRLIKDSKLHIVDESFDKKVTAQSDIDVSIFYNGNSLLGIINNGRFLTQDKHYFHNRNGVTIKKEYLGSLDIGIAKLTFDFDKGQDSELNINVIDTTTLGEETDSTDSPEKEPAKDNNSIQVTLDKNVAKHQIDKATFEKVLEHAKTDNNGIKTVTVESNKVEGTASYTLELPASAVTSDSLSQKVEFKTDVATVIIPGNMIKSKEEKNAENISLSVALADKSGLDDATQAAIGDRPLLDLNLRVDGKITSWENPEAPVTVSIPYTPTAEELKNPEKIVVWYLDYDGNPIPVSNGKYDTKTSTVSFEATHFSKYAVVYSDKSFDDIAGYDWAKKEIEVLAAKGIINGTSQTTFNPEANITRADFLVMLVKTFGLTANVNSNFSDVFESDYYYKAVGIAKNLGITGGTGNNNFNPKAPISRQEMMTLLAKAMSLKNKLSIERATADLNKFADRKDISEYAIKSMAALVNEGIVTGEGEYLNPLKNATRAETAVLLYKAYNK